MMRKIMSLICISVICGGLLVPVHAQSMEEVREYEVVSQLDSQDTRATVIVRKHRYFNGIRQYRRWNETFGYWVDPYWITLK